MKPSKKNNKFTYQGNTDSSEVKAIELLRIATKNIINLKSEIETLLTKYDPYNLSDTAEREYLDLWYKLNPSGNPIGYFGEIEHKIVEKVQDKQIFNKLSNRKVEEYTKWEEVKRSIIKYSYYIWYGIAIHGIKKTLEKDNKSYLESFKDFLMEYVNRKEGNNYPRYIKTYITNREALKYFLNHLFSFKGLFNGDIKTVEIQVHLYTFCKYALKIELFAPIGGTTWVWKYLPTKFTSQSQDWIYNLYIEFCKKNVTIKSSEVPQENVNESLFVKYYDPDGGYDDFGKIELKNSIKNYNVEHLEDFKRLFKGVSITKSSRSLGKIYYDEKSGVIRARNAFKGGEILEVTVYKLVDTYSRLHHEVQEVAIPIEQNYVALVLGYIPLCRRTLEPNCQVHFLKDSNKAVLQTTRPIREGEEITIQQFNK